MNHHPIDEQIFPPDYIQTEQTNRLRECLGEKAWQYLELLELLDKTEDLLAKLGRQNVSGQHDMLVEAVGYVKRMRGMVRGEERGQVF